MDEAVAERSARVLQLMHEGKLIVSWDQSADLRKSFDPYISREQEKEIRDFLSDRNCIKIYRTTQVATVEPMGRKALAYPGGAFAFWKHQEEEERLRLAHLRSLVEPKKVGFWGWVDRFNKLLPIPTAVLAIVTLWLLVAQRCSPSSSQVPASAKGQDSATVAKP